MKKYFCTFNRVTPLNHSCFIFNRSISAFNFFNFLYFYCCILLITGLLLTAHSVQAEVNSGDILVLDIAGGSDGRGALYVVNPKSGQRTILSDFGNTAQGELGLIASSVVVFKCNSDKHNNFNSQNKPHSECAKDELLQIFVSDIFAGGEGGAIFKIDSSTGDRTLVSNFGQGNIRGPLYPGLAVNEKGQILTNIFRLIPDNDNLNPAIVRINPESDMRIILSDFTNLDQGTVVQDWLISDLIIEPSGEILTGTSNVNGLGAAIYRVNPKTGKRTILSDFTNGAQGPSSDLLYNPGGLAIEKSRKILALSSPGPNGGTGNFLLRINPKTGQRVILSNFDDPKQGPLEQNIVGVAIEKSGKIIASGQLSEDNHVLFRINPKTGERVVLSDDLNSDQGPKFNLIQDTAIVPSVERP